MVGRVSPVADTHLARTVDERLRSLGLSARAVSISIGQGADFIRAILDGRSTSPRAESLQKLADALGCSSMDLLGHEAAFSSQPGPEPAVDDLALMVRSRIADRLEALGLTPITAATEAGLPRDTLRNLFRGDATAPRVDTLASIAKALGTTAAYLMGEVAGGAEEMTSTLSQQAAPAAEAARLKAALRSIRTRLQKLIDEIDELSGVG